MNSRLGLRGRIQRLQEKTASKGVMGIVTPQGGTYLPEDQKRLEQQIKDWCKAGYWVYVAHMARELRDNEPREIV